MKKPITVLGVMTGTSCDGADLACVEFGATMNHLFQKSFAYPKKLRTRVLDLQNLQKKPLSLRAFQELDRDLGLWMSQCVQSALVAQKITPDAIAVHGQTVYHGPAKNAASALKGTTLQMMDTARISAATGITTLSQFRKGDVASGGQGAPLVPLYHQALAHQHFPNAMGVAFHNLGGISNLTYISPESTLAFDTGPANLWIDDAVRKMSRGKRNFDPAGSLALKGTPDDRAVLKLLKHPFLKKVPPKSTGRDDFAFSLLEKATRAKGNDLIATATHFTILSIAEAYQRHILDRGLPLETIVFCGGGAKNLTILEGVEVCLPGVEVTTSDALGISSQYMEAMAFAYFGYLSLLGKEISGPWTLYPNQKNRPLYPSPAQIQPGKNWTELLDKTTTHLSNRR